MKEAYLVDLIESMLQPKPEARPDAADVLDFLKGGRKSVAAARIPEVGVAKVPPKESVRESVKVPVKEPPTAAAAKAPAAPPSPPRPAAEAKAPVAKGFASPWAEHAIAWLPDKIAGMRFVSCEQTEAGGKHCYRFYRADGTGMIFTIEKLMMLGLAVSSGAPRAAAKAEPAGSPPPAPPKAELVSAGENSLWEKDAAYAVDTAVLTRDGYHAIVKTDKGGKKGYLAVGTGGRERYIPLQTLVMLGYLKRR